MKDKFLVLERDLIIDQGIMIYKQMKIYIYQKLLNRLKVKKLSKYQQGVDMLQQ